METNKDTEIPLKEQWAVIKRLFNFAKPFRRMFFSAIVFALILAIINVLLPRILQVFIDNHLKTNTATLNVLLFFSVLYFIGTLIKAIVWFFQSYLYNYASLKTYQHIRIRLFEKLHTQGMSYFDRVPAGSIVSRVTNDTETLFEFWQVFLMLLTGVFAILSSFLAMFQIDQQIALTNLIYLPLLLLIIAYYQKFSSKIFRRMRERLSQLNTKLNETISGMQIVQQFKQETRLINEFEAVNDAYLETRLAMIKINSILLGPIINLLYTVAVAASLAFFGFKASFDPIEIGLVFVFTSYIQAFFSPMTQMMDFLSTFSDGIVAGSRIFAILDSQESEPKQQATEEREIKKGKIEFRNVTFSYDGQHPVLNDISFTVNPGETIALVGHTGSGKSSIINLLMRFYEFQEGTILIDDQDIRSFPRRELQGKIGLVLQDAFMFYGTIEENIRLFNQSISDQEVLAAAKFVQIDQFIKNLSNGYQTKVLEGGAGLSSGQKQLISFARTIVTQPKILVLDEATATIDSETEQLIQAGLLKMQEGRTTVAIAHRLSTIKQADKILVLDKGVIVERGNHEDLLALGGIYADMYKLQMNKDF